MSRPKRMKPPPGSSRPVLEAQPAPHQSIQQLEHGEHGTDSTPFTLERWNVLLESGNYSVKALEARLKDLPVTMRWIARLQLEMYKGELEPGE